MGIERVPGNNATVESLECQDGHPSRRKDSDSEFIGAIVDCTGCPSHSEHLEDFAQPRYVAGEMSESAVGVARLLLN